MQNVSVGSCKVLVYISITFLKLIITKLIKLMIICKIQEDSI